MNIIDDSIFQTMCKSIYLNDGNYSIDDMLRLCDNGAPSIEMMFHCFYLFEKRDRKTASRENRLAGRKNTWLKASLSQVF